MWHRGPRPFLFSSNAPTLLFAQLVPVPVYVQAVWER